MSESTSGAGLEQTGPVRRIQDERGSHIEPELDQKWTELEKLRWHVAVTKVDSGLEVRVNESEARPGCFTLFGASSGSSHYYSYSEAWQTINDWETGARHMRAQLESVSS